MTHVRQELALGSVGGVGSLFRLGQILLCPFAVGYISGDGRNADNLPIRSS